MVSASISWLFPTNHNLRAVSEDYVSGRSSRSTLEPENLAERLMVSSVRKMSARATGVPMNTLASVLNRSALQHLTHDGVLLFLTRFVRLFSYGALSVVLVFYLTGLGLSQSQTG